VIGRHEGITHYTVGQRRGLHVAMGKRVFVQRIDAEKNQVILGEDADIYTDHLYADHLNAMAVEHFSEGQHLLAKIRYAHEGTMCRITVIGEDEIRLDFDEPVRAVTPGQAVVLYLGEYVAGGGLIR
jgi:tRNA-specific 2-thiouridylase